MFKMRKCCNNPEYETIDSFYTYKEEPKRIYNYNNPYTYTYVTMPDKIINRIIEKANGIDFDKLKQLIHDEFQHVIIENTNKEKKSYIEIQKCKHCGYIKKIEVKI